MNRGHIIGVPLYFVLGRKGYRQVVGVVRKSIPECADCCHLDCVNRFSNGANEIPHSHVRWKQPSTSFKLSVCQIAAKSLHGKQGACATNTVPAVVPFSERKGGIVLCQVLP